MPAPTRIKPAIKIEDAPDALPKAPSAEARNRVLKVIAAELSTARQRAGITVAELHRRTGISRTVLQGYEAARFAPGSIELKKVCEVLGVTPNRVVFGDEKPLEVKPLLESYIGDLSKAVNVVRLGTIFQVLTTQEQGAVIALIESIATPRMGGVEQMKIAMEAVSLLLNDTAIDPQQLQQFGESMLDNLPPDTKEKMIVLDEKSKAVGRNRPPRREK